MIETLLGGLLGGSFRLAPELLKWLDRKGASAVAAVVEHCRTDQWASRIRGEGRGIIHPVRRNGEAKLIKER